jgi:formylglycine-generating enzyme required for sulfatase activity/serine/threonine protein kinase
MPAMSPDDLSQCCPGCLQGKGEALVCPLCGYDESKAPYSIALPSRTLLHGQYWIGRVLGKLGGFGITYLAWDTGLDIPVAIKEYLPRDLAGRDSASLAVSAHSGEDGEYYRNGLKAFLDEAKTLAKFNHPNVVKARHVFEDNGTAYLVMEYLEGETLHEYLEKQPGSRLSQARALEILLPVLEGLEEVHSQGFLHRDIKPHNLYLSKPARNRPERAILLDFGAARLVLGERSRSLSIMLTPGYASPEQYHSRGQGPWTDVYGVASVLYRMTTGVIPQESGWRMLEDRLADPRELAPELTPEFAAALVYGLTLIPQQRPQTVEEFKYLLMPPGYEPATQHTQAPTYKLPPTLSRPNGTPPPPPPTPPAKAWGAGKKWAVGGAGLAAVAALAWGGWKYFLANGPIYTMSKPPTEASAQTLPPQQENLPAAALAPEASPVPPMPAPTESVCRECPDMVSLPPGEFLMGADGERDPDAQRDEKPRHLMRVSKAFSISKYEVTRAQFAAFADETGYQAPGCYTWSGSSWKLQPDKDWRNPGFSQSGEHPVTCISHQDAQAYIEWLNRKTGKHFRLPTEAEWEYAARAGTETVRYWGDNAEEACRYANVADQSAKQAFPGWRIHNCNDGYIYTAPVGSFIANRFGLHDMLGNVWEWTCSAYTDNGYDQAEHPCSTDAKSQQVYRGGSWGSRPSGVRSAGRSGYNTSDRFFYIGFRLAQE